MSQLTIQVEGKDVVLLETTYGIRTITFRNEVALRKVEAKLNMFSRKFLVANSGLTIAVVSTEIVFELVHD